MSRRALAGALALALAAAARAAPDEPAASDYVEEVVVEGRPSKGVEHGVVRIDLVDDEGVPVRDVVASELVLNDGFLSADALVHVRRAPDLHFLIDRTVVPIDGPDPILATMRAVLAAFPDGRARVSLVQPGDSTSVAFDLGGIDACWVPCLDLLAFLESPAHPTLGATRIDMPPAQCKRLCEQIRDAALELDEEPDRERFVVLLSDGFDGATLASYDLCCYPRCLSCQLLPRPGRAERESEVASALAAARAHLIFEVVPRYPGYGDAMGALVSLALPTDRTRLAAFADGHEGAGAWRPEPDPMRLGASIGDDVERRLDSYLLEFSTRSAGAATFLKIEVRRQGVRARPERIGEQLLLGRDAWLVAWTGGRGMMPAALQRALRAAPRE